ncbi:MAG: 2-amino-4-hydroxy-6-hydroxymethyldihydropteridine diphosphokinase [Candidatus Acidiferrales bacterium]
METIFLSLGANVGDRERNIARAIEKLPEHGIHVVRRSSLYETEPVEFLDQHWFLNCVVEAKTDLGPPQLLNALLQIERSLGRERFAPKGPRAIDIDILFFGSEVIQMPQLKIPHPRMADRKFVLVPFAEIAPSTLHPLSRKTIAELLVETPDNSDVRLWKGTSDKPKA